MILEFEGVLIVWRGPAPYFFIPVPEKESGDLKAISGIASYGWGVIPVRARIGATTWQTSLFPKNGGYLTPIKDRVRKAEKLDEGDRTRVRLEVIL
jgi:hypothetical protein